MTMRGSSPSGVAPDSAAPEPTPIGSLECLAERLRDTEELFQSWLDDAPIACHEIDREGIVLRVNRAECELLGLSAAEILGRYVWDFMAPEEGQISREVLRELVLGNRKPEPFEREHTRRDGSQLTVEIHPKLMRDATGAVTGVRAFRLDVTARKRADEALKRQAEKLARSNRELEQFAYVASHDLQEPLRKIQAFGDRLRSKCGAELSEDAQDCLKRMQNAAARMQALIQDLLSLSRVSSQSQPFAPVHLGDVAQQVLSDLEMRLEQLSGHVELDFLPTVMGDRIQLAQLFQNLIGNALKFHKPGQPPVVKVWSEIQPGPAGICRIMIEDNGIGFDEKYLDRVFQIFQRLHGRNEYEGTGIGLAICRKIVDRHGGSITASSAPGKGAKFIVALPLKPLSGESSNE